MRGVEGLQAEVAVLRVRLEKAEALNQGPKLMADMQVLNKRLDQVEAIAGGKAMAGASDATTEVASLRSGLEAVRSEVGRVAQDLMDERRDRCRALSDINRITEDVAKAAAATIERAERRFAQEFHGDQWDTHSNDSRRTKSGTDENSVIKSAEASLTPMTTDEVRVALGTSMAKLVGEMDAELRVELTSRIRLVAAELRGEIQSDVAVRIAAVEARIAVIETNSRAEIQRLDRDHNSRLTALEAAQAGPRLAVLEEEAKCTARSLVTLLSVTQKQAADLLFDGIEAKSHPSLAIGKSPSSQTEHLEVSHSSLSSPKAPIRVIEGVSFANGVCSNSEDSVKKSIDNILSASTRSPSRADSTKPMGNQSSSRTLGLSARGHKTASRSPEGLRSLGDSRSFKPDARVDTGANQLQKLDEAAAQSVHEYGADRNMDTISESVHRRASLPREAASVDRAVAKQSSGLAARLVGAASADVVTTAMRGATGFGGTDPRQASRSRQPSLNAAPSVASQPKASPTLSPAGGWHGSTQTPSPAAASRGAAAAATSASTVSAVRPQQANSTGWALFRGRPGVR